MSDSRLVRVQDTRALLWLCIAAVVAASAAGLAGGWAGVPIAVRFVIGLCCFGLCPGLLILAVLQRREREDGIAHTALTAVALTFSCNLVLNVLLFLTHVSFRPLVVGYLVAQALGLAVTVWVLWTRPSRLPLFTAAPPLRLSRGRVLAAALLGAGFAAAVVYTYNQPICGLPIAPIEELVVLRKLAENPSIAYDNISFFKGEPSTYLFVPFQIFVVGVSTVSGLDVSLVYIAFHAVTTGLALVAMLLLVDSMFRDRRATLVLALTMLVGLGTDLRGVILDLGLVAPCPNRFGFAGGVLLPLTLLMFLRILTTAHSHSVEFFLLVYFVVEMTFVHARETLFAFGVMAAVTVLLLPGYRSHLALLRRMALAMACTVAILLAYKYVNLALSSGLERYVSLLTVESRAELMKLFREHGLGAFFAPGPSRLSVTFPEVGLEVPHGVPGYRDLVNTWSRGYYPTRVLFPLILLALPLMAAKARSVAELSLPAILGATGLMLLSGPMKMTLAWLVGNPEVLVVFGVVYLLAFLLLARMVSRGAQAVAGLASRPVLAAAITLLAAAVIVALHTLPARAALAGVWTRGFATVLHLATLAIVARRWLTAPLPLFPTDGPAAKGATALAVSLVLVHAGAAAWQSRVWQRWPPEFKYPPGRFSGRLVQDYPLLAESHRIQPDLDLGVLAFLRDGVPPQQVVLGANTVAVLATTTHFASILTSAGDREVNPAYIANWTYLLRHQVRKGPFRLNPILRREDGEQRLRAMLRDLGVDLLMVGPEESDRVQERVAGSPGLSACLEPVYRENGHAIYRVQCDRPLAASAAPPAP